MNRFSVEFEDASTQITASVLRANCAKWFKISHVGDIVAVSQASVKPGFVKTEGYANVDLLFSHVTKVKKLPDEDIGIDKAQ